jgi:hypothetical protein
MPDITHAQADAVLAAARDSGSTVENDHTVVSAGTAAWR